MAEPLPFVSDEDPDRGYERPIRSRYRDPVELIWIVTARRLGLTVRRNAEIYSATDGRGLLEHGPQETLDPDDSLAQMIFHELCHWITNGVESFHERDWGFPLDAELDWREHSGVRLQAALAAEHGLRGQFAPTSHYRAYYDRLPADPFAPLDDSEREAAVVARAREAFVRAHGEPWGETLQSALRATAQIRGLLGPFLVDYTTDLPDDRLPSVWAE